MLTTVREALPEERVRNEVTWLCLCDCGNSVFVPARYITNGRKKSCGCKSKPKTDIISGEKYCALTAIREATKEEQIDNRITWLFKCDCGNKILARAAHVLRGTQKSCGCFRTRKGESNPMFKSGGNKNPTYRRWRAMINRCYAPSQKENIYQQKNITVCERWLESYDNFLADMGECPSLKHSLDRIDNNKGYSPDNCRWATAKQQARNKRNNVYADGHLVAELAEKHNISKALLYQRIKHGKSGDALVAKPIQHNRSYDTNRGRGRLTKEQVIEIKQRCAQGEPYLQIAKDYPVARQAIANIAQGKTYKHI